MNGLTNVLGRCLNLQMFFLATETAEVSLRQPHEKQPGLDFRNCLEPLEDIDGDWRKERKLPSGGHAVMKAPPETGWQELGP